MAGQSKGHVGGVPYSTAYTPDTGRLDDQLRAFDKNLAHPRGWTATRFPRTLIFNNLLDAAERERRRRLAASKATTKQKKKDRFVAANTEENPQYTVNVAFSLDGQYFSEPFVNPVADKKYQVKVTVTQHHGGKLFQGLGLQWVAGAGWIIKDDQPTTTYHEFISNPLVITRIYQSPHVIAAQVGFRIHLIDWFA